MDIGLSAKDIERYICLLGCPRVSCVNEKFAGIILLKCQTDSTRVDCEKVKVDFSWAHTTRTMAVGYMSVGDKTPRSVLHCYL